MNQWGRPAKLLPSLAHPILQLHGCNNIYQALKYIENISNSNTGKLQLNYAQIIDIVKRSEKISKTILLFGNMIEHCTQNKNKQTNL